MTVEAIMSCDVVTVNPDESLMVARMHLQKMGIRHLLVVENERLVGVISDRDVLRELSPFLDSSTEKPRDVKTLVRRARDIMAQHVVTIRPEATIEEAARLMLHHNISSLPVISDEETVEGIVTSKDVMKHFAGKS